MTTNNKKIKCPECGESISIDDALTHQLEDKIKKELQEENKIKRSEMAKEKKVVEEKTRQLDEAQKNVQIEVNKKVNEKLATEKVNLWRKAKVEAEKQKTAEIKLLEEQIKARGEKLIEDSRKENEGERKMLEEQLADKDLKLKEANQNELTLRKEKQKLKDEKDAFELEKTRQLDEERKSIEEKASKKATEAQQSKIDQLRKQVSDANKTNDELTRQLGQGSQQTQGEVFELKLEEIISKAFPFDEVEPVPKGVSGADIVQKVRDRNGRECGQIIWESKNRKAWSEGWVQKLKDDQRAVKADLAVIVSSVLPRGMNGFNFHNGVWVCSVNFSTALATALRANLIALNQEKMMSVGKNEKMEVLYSYLTGIEFKQRVEAIIEAFSGMDAGLRKEKLVYQKLWSEREKQIQKVIANTAGMYGDLSGLVTLPKIKTLELGEGNSDVKDTKKG